MIARDMSNALARSRSPFSSMAKAFRNAVLLLLSVGLVAGSGCSAQSPAPPVANACAAGLLECGGACSNPQSDPANCGACGHVCAGGLFCSLGACSQTCAASTTACAGQCVDVRTNAANCGACGAVCTAGQSCAGGVCSAGVGAGGGGNIGSGGSGGNIGSGGGAGAPGTGNGLQVGSVCFPVCQSAATDPDGDGYGQEAGRSCVVAGSPPSVGARACTPPPPTTTIPPGDGFYLDGMCVPRCASDVTDPDATGARDGWGYELGRTCIVVGSTPALQGIPCIPSAAPTGDGYQVGTACVPACTHPLLADAQGYGYEAQQTCVVAGSVAALQSGRCVVPPRNLPPPGPGTLLGQTCFPACGPNATDLTPDGYGFDLNRSCVVPGSTATIQGVPCVPPPATVTGECPRTLTCPVVNGVSLPCGCTWVDGLAERKQAIMATAGASQYFVASAMLETSTLTADYTLGDGKTGDSFNAGICKQNWSMTRRCHPAWVGQTAAQFATSIAMNTNLALDIQVYNECRSMFGADWWSGHRAGFGSLGSNTQDIQQFKGAMDWINGMLTTHLADDVRVWVTIQAI
jgi:Stigma-specific protein, Stig1